MFVMLNATYTYKVTSGASTITCYTKKPTGPARKLATKKVGYELINEIFVMRLFKNKRRKSALQLITSFSSVLSSFLKAVKVNLYSFRVVDRLFQAAGPATENPRLPIVTVFADGMRRSPAAANRRWERPSRDEMGTQRSRKYIGAVRPKRKFSCWNANCSNTHNVNKIYSSSNSRPI